MPQPLNEVRLSVTQLHVQYGGVSLARQEQHVGVRIEQRHQHSGGTVQLQRLLGLGQVADVADHDLTESS